MRIKGLRLNNWEVIRQADFENLNDFVVIARRPSDTTSPASLISGM
jgi:hypothetical protein